MLSDTLIYGFIAQLAEHSAVNRKVVGSNPTVSVYYYQLNKENNKFIGDYGFESH